ncbi:hypothetical protein NLU13_5640 [Sarocladium strictum]|uniref:Uncharacterized protein n=1 Tax=Sarocladium strictum TaxID=5046 RepID=A0AA39GJS6_SARSR|nr:hypothetical protein NLU13_5640 [Sarocladium strictum]
MPSTELHDSPVRDSAADAERKAGYKSWKKKYRKMRITFDRKMHDSEELHRQEEKASATIKRLAIENDRLLDTLAEVNSMIQLPGEKRIDLDLEQPTVQSKEGPLVYLSTLEKEVPHLTYATAKDKSPDLVADLTTSESEPSPASFLTPDDIDDYIYEVDTSLFDDAREVPSLAPKANPAAHPPTNPSLKNPTSVTNWLRKHAPKIFLQDGEDVHPDDEQQPKKSRAKAADKDKVDKPATAKTKGKRASLAAAAAKEGSVDEDAEMAGASTPVGRGAGKRKRDDDPGYKPKSGARPTKKKRKSEGEVTSSGRKSKKDTAEAVTPSAKDD